MNFAQKQSDNLEQQERSPSSGGQSPLQRLLSILRPRPDNTELSALVSEEPEELESDDDEGLISFEEERVRLLNVELQFIIYIHYRPKVQKQGGTLLKFKKCYFAKNT